MSNIMHISEFIFISVTIKCFVSKVSDLSPARKTRIKTYGQLYMEIRTLVKTCCCRAGHNKKEIKQKSFS